ncbi:hypothetical protein SAMD00019534_100950 [Acytostelium subglobosum LB1]|uniref:hypothetical protein n=1 Tax=Acytostelium subglobosum LB1 TaxID=1410327 RepID=UPI000644F334|nr:hypothetical protein SAMD00019534_100950 [Acytostelium subglobosum LB1]GAM26920.1 hypothetical protein SAMD00019534_100950 [Acytostelium subglobosum LB1]|eukprot:XP_012750188.1 hypothetical protein SAMD00019534_100950 [Acytostelium subglobosum LB1]
MNLGTPTNTSANSTSSTSSSSTTGSGSTEDVTITIYPIGIKTYGCLPPFLMRKHTLFKRLFVHVSNRFCIDENELLFFFQEKLLPDQCPGDVGLLNGDIIVVRRVPPKARSQSSNVKAATSAFVCEIGSLFDNPSFSDISFVLSDGSILPSHKNVLSSRCQRFKAMFQGSMKESQESELKVEEHSPAVFRKMIEYIYTDAMNEEDMEMILKLIIIADEYLLESLKGLCEQKLIGEINIANAPLLFSHSDVYNCKQLKKHALNFILSSIKRIAGTKEFERDLSTSPGLLLEIIKEMAPLYDSGTKRRKDVEI